MFDLFIDWAMIIAYWCHSTIIRGLGTLQYMINIDWPAVCVEVDSMHMICASILSLECLQTARVEAW